MDAMGFCDLHKSGSMMEDDTCGDFDQFAGAAPKESSK